MSSSPRVFSASSFGPCQYWITLRSLSQLITPVLSTLPSPASAVLFRLRSIDSLNCYDENSDLKLFVEASFFYTTIILDQVSSVSSRTVTQTQKTGTQTTHSDSYRSCNGHVSLQCHGLSTVHRMMSCHSLCWMIYRAWTHFKSRKNLQKKNFETKSLHTHIYIQWNLRIKDTLGAELLSSFRRLSSGGRFIQITIYGHIKEL